MPKQMTTAELYTLVMDYGQAMWRDGRLFERSGRIGNGYKARTVDKRRCLRDLLLPSYRSENTHPRFIVDEITFGDITL